MQKNDICKMLPPGGPSPPERTGTACGAAEPENGQLGRLRGGCPGPGAAYLASRTSGIDGAALPQTAPTEGGWGQGGYHFHYPHIFFPYFLSFLSHFPSFSFSVPKFRTTPFFHHFLNIKKSFFFHTKHTGKNASQERGKR